MDGKRSTLNPPPSLPSLSLFSLSLVYQIIHGQRPLRAQQLLGLAVGVGVLVHLEDEGGELLWMEREQKTEGGGAG